MLIFAYLEHITTFYSAWRNAFLSGPSGRIVQTELFNLLHSGTESKSTLGDYVLNTTGLNGASNFVSKSSKENKYQNLFPNLTLDEKKKPQDKKRINFLKFEMARTRNMFT